MTLAIDPRLLAPQPNVRIQHFSGTQYNVIGNSTSFSDVDWTLSGEVVFSVFDGNNETIWSQQDGTGSGRSWLYVNSATQKWESFIGGSSLLFDTNIDPATIGAWYTFNLQYDHASNQLTLDINGTSDTKTGVVAESATGDLIVGTAKNLNPITSLNGTLRNLRLNNVEYYNGQTLLV